MANGENKISNLFKKADKKNVKTTIIIIVALVALLGASAYFLFHDSKSKVYREVRTGTAKNIKESSGDSEYEFEDEDSIPADISSTVRMNSSLDEFETEDEESEEDDNNSYMTVTIPGFSDEDVKKAEEEEAAVQLEQASTGIDSSTIRQTQRTRTDTSSPAVVDHYYTTPSSSSTGNSSSGSSGSSSSTTAKTTKPTSTSDTVYVLEYDKGETLTESDVQNIILDYLNSDKTFIDQTTQKVSNTNSGNDDAGMIVEGDADSNDLDVKTGTNELNVKPSDTESDSIISSELHGDAAGVDVGYQYSDDYVKPYLQWYVDGTDGTVKLNVIGIASSEIKSIVWDANLVAGSGYLMDTENPLEKFVHVEDSSAIAVMATVTFRNGLVKNTEVSLVKHQNYIGVDTSEQSTTNQDGIVINQ